MKRTKWIVCVACTLLLAASWALGDGDIAGLMSRYSASAQEAVETAETAWLGIKLTEREEEIFRLGVAWGYDRGAAQTGSQSGVLVWVPTNGGSRYHCEADCSGMVDPVQVPLEQAKAANFTPCKRCDPAQ